MSLFVDRALRNAKNQMKAGELAKAEELYKQVLSKFPKNKKAIQEYQKLKAEITLEASSCSQPPHEQIQALISLYNQGSLTAALDQAKILTQRYPKAFVAWNILGASSKVLGGIVEASKAFKKVTELKPNYADGFNNLGVTLTDQGKLDEAIETLHKALILNPNFTDAYYNLGIALREKCDLDAAINSFKKAIQIKPDNAEAYNNMGISLQEKGKSDAAVDSYKQAIKIKPDYAEAYNNMGNALYDRGDLDAAINNYKQTLKIKPDYAEAYNNMGLALQDKCELGAAIDSYRQAIKIKPDSVKAMRNLVKLPIGNLIKEDLEGLKVFLNKYASKLKILSDREFLEAGYLLHSGETELAFAKFCQANKTKLLTLNYNFKDQKRHYKYYLQKIERWKPITPAMKDHVLKKIFILGPSRSGKSTLEYLLSNNPKIKPLYEPHRVIPNEDANFNLKGQFDFEKVFFQHENKLIKQGYEAITSTNPNLLYSVMSLADKLPNAYFVFLNRDQKNIAPEIFSKDYNKGHYYSYDPHTILEYLDFYKAAMDRLEEKAPNIISKFTFEQIIENPLDVVTAVGKFTSLDLSLSGFDFPKKKSIYHNNFNFHFQKLIMGR